MRTVNPIWFAKMLMPKAQLTIDSLTATAFRRKFAFCSSFLMTARFAGAFQNHTEPDAVSGSSSRILRPDRTRRMEANVVSIARKMPAAGQKKPPK